MSYQGMQSKWALFHVLPRRIKAARRSIRLLDETREAANGGSVPPGMPAKEQAKWISDERFRDQYLGVLEQHAHATIRRLEDTMDDLATFLESDRECMRQHVPMADWDRRGIAPRTPQKGGTGGDS